MLGVWVGRVGGGDGELRPWHYIYAYTIESRLIMRVRFEPVKFGAAKSPGSPNG